MINLINFVKNHKLISAVLFLSIISIILTIFSPKNTPKSPTVNPPSIVVPNPTIFPGNAFKNHKATIGETTNAQLKNLPNLIEEKTASDGGKIFSYTSSLLDRPNLVTTSPSGIATFERGVIPSGENISLSEIKSKLGDEEKLIEGSSYGKAVNTYIYSSRGFSILANPFSDEIYEVQTFIPMSADNYITIYADKGNNTNAEEGN